MKQFIPHLIFLETTRACNMKCPHCRASATDTRMPDELTTDEIKKLIDEAASFSKPIFVLSGGEPLSRPDIYEIASYGNERGLKMTLATNASLITESVASSLKSSGIERVAVSIYGSTPKLHDSFCGTEGAFDATYKGVENIKRSGMELQINTTITRRNLADIMNIANWAVEIGAQALHLFFLVPTGRGKALEGDEITPHEYEKAFNEICDFSKVMKKIHVKTTCAPHYFRILHQRGTRSSQLIAPSSFYAMTKGCLAGSGVCFVSYKGEVYPCGYFPVLAGNIRENNFKDIWFNSPLFLSLRDEAKLKGKCGFCEFKLVCGGCRARAYARYGDYLEEEPYCAYTPRRGNVKANK